MTISKDDVHTVARLARLKLEPEAEGKLAQELDKILTYVHKLDELDTSNVPPTAQVTVDASPLREDLPRDGVAKADALSMAPRSDETGFLVPGFVDES